MSSTKKHQQYLGDLCVTGKYACVLNKYAPVMQNNIGLDTDDFFQYRENSLMFY